MGRDWRNVLRWWVTGLVGLAFWVRAAGLAVQGLWRDEVDALLFATAPLSEVLGNFSRPGWNGPFYFFVLRAWVALTGTSAYALRYFSLLGALVSIVLIYKLGKRMVGWRAALGGTVLAVCSPYWVWYAQEVKMYTWVPALALLALYALERAAVRPRWGWWVTVLGAITLAFYSHILAALLIPVAGVWFLLIPGRSPKAWRGALVTLALLTLPYLPLLLWQGPLIFQKRVTGFPAYTLGQMVGMLLSGWSTGIAGIGEWLGGVMIALMGTLAILGLWELISAGKWRRTVQLLSWLALPLLAIWWVSLNGPIFTDRYLIWTSAAFYLAVGCGLAALRYLWRGIPVLGLIVLVALNGFGLYRQLSQPLKPQYESAVNYLAAHAQVDELLLFQIPYNQRVLEYYAPGHWPRKADAPFTNWRNADGNYQVGPEYVDQEMRRLTAGGGGLWLIYSEVALWDDRQLVKAWLDQQGQLTDTREFYLVTLYHYEVPISP